MRVENSRERGVGGAVRVKWVMDRSRVVVVAALLVGMLVPTVSSAAPPALVGFSATGCREIGSFFFLPVAQLRPYVPAELTVAEVHPGLGEVLVLNASCDRLSARGASRPVLFSEVGIYIKDVDRTPSWHYFGLWHATNHKQLAAALSRLGVSASLVTAMSFAGSSGPAQAEATVPRRPGAYRVKAVVPSPRGIYGARPSTWWYRAPHGYVRVRYQISGYSGTAGVSQFKTDAGTPLGALLGTAERLSDSALLEDYPKLTATVDRVRL